MRWVIAYTDLVHNEQQEIKMFTATASRTAMSYSDLRALYLAQCRNFRRLANRTHDPRYARDLVIAQRMLAGLRYDA